MSTQPQTQEILFTARNVAGGKRPALRPLAIALATIAVISVVLLVVSSVGLFSPNYRLVAILGVDLAIVLLAFVFYFLYRLRLESSAEYTLDLTTEGVRERIVEMSGRHLEAKMNYADIDFVEHFTPRDRDTLVFHSLDNRIIEMPVWSIRDQVPTIIDLLQQHGIRVLRT